MGTDIEVRGQMPDEVDEVLVTLDGRVRVHLERLSDDVVWIGLTGADREYQINLIARGDRRLEMDVEQDV